jgi:signal transduction histidine kinase
VVETGKKLKVNDLNGILFSSAEKQIQHILDAIPFHVLLVDSSHNIVAANRKLVQDLQLSPGQLVGGQCPLLLHGSDSPIEKCPLVEALGNGEPVERDLFDSAKSMWVQAAVFPTALVGENGGPLFLHFARDITQVKKTEERLSLSLEHHTALSELLQCFQNCQTSSEILDALVTKIITLSWLGMTTTAVGFLTKNNRLEMTVHYNAAAGQLSRCKSVAFGECLCGKAAESGRSFICASDEVEHSVRYESMQSHRHVILPIRHEGRTLGVVTLYVKDGTDPGSFQLDFLNAAISAAGSAMAARIAQDNAKQVREKSLAQVFSYQEDERKRLSRELHDQVCQSLSALLLEMQSHASADESLRELQYACAAKVRGLIDEVREMAAQLRPAILDDYGLEMALARKVEEISTKSGLIIDYQYVSGPEKAGRLPAPIEVGLYRVATEALSNIVSHASASRASAIILRQDSRVMLLVEDDGCGFDYTSVRKHLEGCLGLIGMEERVALMGGTFRIESTSKGGTTLRVEIPVESAASGDGTLPTSAV